MKRWTHRLYLSCCLYLWISLLWIISLFGQGRYALVCALIHLACIILSTLSYVLLRRGYFKIAQNINLLAIGAACVQYLNNEISYRFPTLLNVQVTFGGSYSNGEYNYLGLDVVLGVMFLLIWFSKDPVKAEQITDDGIESIEKTDVQHKGMQ